MLSKEELLDTPISFNAYQKEKDYLQHIVLSRIYANIGNELVFKGETSLQKCYGLNRFSEDLDFTASGAFRGEKIERALSEVNRFYPSSYSKLSGNLSINYVIKIRGPLFHTPLSLQTIRIDVSLREKVILPPLNYNIMPIYRDLGPYMVNEMDLKEIFSEKIRALMTRKQVRDLYDIYFLIKKNVVLDFSLVSVKMEYYKKTYNYDEADKRIKMLRTQWEIEIPALVLNPPSFDIVASEVSDYLRSH